MIGLSSRVLQTFAISVGLGLASTASAHFQTLIPSTDNLDADSGRKIEFDLRFTHPMEGAPLMEMAPPERFAVIGPDGEQDLRDTLRQNTVDGKHVYQANYTATKPGDLVFYVVPAAYWEPAEGVWIRHYTKVVVNAFNGGGGWDRDLDLPAEIVPLSRPYGLWTGNLFTGVVKSNGKPVPFAEVEVEWLNDGSLTPPPEPFVTQVIKADANGTFSYAMPRAGWWGFAALLTGPQEQPDPNGKPVPVENGGLIWVRATDMP